MKYSLYMFHRRYSKCRPQNSARYNRIICQRVENMSFLETLSCKLHAFAKGYEGYNPIWDFTFLWPTKSGKSRIKIPFLDSLKGTHPKRNRLNFWSSQSCFTGVVNLVLLLQTDIFQCELPFIDKPMAINEPAIESARLVGSKPGPETISKQKGSTKIVIDSCSLSSSTPKESKWNECSCRLVIIIHNEINECLPC